MKNLSKQTTMGKLMFSGCVLLLVFMLPACSGLHNSTNYTVNSTVKLNSDILVGPGECVLKKFQGTSVNNKFYLYWVFQSNNNQFFFQIESSVDGKKFRPCFFKHGTSSPGANNLMICMTDSVNKNDVVYYRIKAIPENCPIKKKSDEEHKELFMASTIMLTKNKKTRGYMQDESFTETNFEAMNR